MSAATPGSLFVSSDYLTPLVEHACISTDAGWTALEQTATFLKQHSWGEFVFDFAWANAYARHGLDYYPKLVLCSPFTPVPGPRLLGQTPEAITELAEQQQASSAHALFCLPDEAELLAKAGWLRRQDLRFIWRNQCGEGHYNSFEEFLTQLSQKKRKNIRRERRRVQEAGVTISWRAAKDIKADEWPLIFQLYSSTYAMRGQSPYLNLACLQDWAASFGERFQFCLAHHQDDLIAMAFFFVEADTLYGRHWGAAANYHSLHFELCYYQGIEFAIQHGLARYDAGVQGEHKIARGFNPEVSTSMHWIKHNGFREAIAHWLQQERAAVQEQLSYINQHSAFKQLAKQPAIKNAAIDL